MPQHTQLSLMHILLLWITILSIVQVVFIIRFFTTGHDNVSQSNSTEERDPSKRIQQPPKNELMGKMLSFQIKEVNHSIKWVAKNPDEGLISEHEGVLKIKMDGYFFLSLQVTLTSCDAAKRNVNLQSNGKAILLGWINDNTCSTGSISKVKELSAGSKLKINLLPADRQKINDSLTHLDIIYMSKKKL